MDQEVYRRAEIIGRPQSITEWLDGLSKDDREDWFMIADREIGDHSLIEFKHAISVAAVLLSYEIDDDNIAIDEAKANELVGKLFANIIIHKGVSDGLYTTTEVLTFYSTKPILLLTELGREINEKLIEARAKSLEDDMAKLYGKSGKKDC